LESLTMEVKLLDNDESCNNIQIKDCYIKYIWCQMVHVCLTPHCLLRIL
jgi:hypothetical protein